MPPADFPQHSHGRDARATAALLLIAAIAIVAGCKSKQEAVEMGPDYSRPLLPGEQALVEVNDPERFRALLADAYDPDDALLVEATRRSAAWYGNPSTKSHFPVAGVTHERARDSVRALADILQKRPTEDEFIREVMSRFALYQSVGWDGRGTVLFTGYYSPVFRASEAPSGEYQYPLYTRPDDLVTDPLTGAPKGRKVGDHVEPYPTRREIEESNMLGGRELVWLADPFDVYIIHVNGSAKLRLTDGSIMHVGYAGKTDRPYKGLGRTMIERGILPESGLSVPSIREYLNAHPDEKLDLIYENENYVFFKEYPPGNWPSGSLGFKVTERRTLATDKDIFPRGSVMIVDTRIPNYVGPPREFTQLMLDQDTGGAIQAPGRADIYMGSGEAAGLLAGRQYQEGEMYYLLLREEAATAAGR